MQICDALCDAPRHCHGVPICCGHVERGLLSWLRGRLLTAPGGRCHMDDSYRRHRAAQLPSEASWLWRRHSIDGQISGYVIVCISGCCRSISDDIMADNRQATARMPRVLRFAAHPPYFGRSLRALLSLLPISPGAPLRSAHTRHASPRASLRRDHEPHNRMPDPAEASAYALHPVSSAPRCFPVFRVVAKDPRALTSGAQTICPTPTGQRPRVQATCSSRHRAPLRPDDV